MKVTASEIKVGQTIKYGNQWGEVIESPKQSPYRANEVTVSVKTLPGSVKRRAGYVDKYTGGEVVTFEYRKSTLVNALD